MKYVMAIETSCDDTSVALVDETGFVKFCRAENQDQVHKPFGGIVPEVAGRQHAENLLPLIETALSESKISWSEVLGIAVTSRPGLVGSLLVGLITAKTLALTHSLKFIGVNHIEGHIWAPFLKDETYKPATEELPFLSLVISGGHSHIFLVKGMGQYKLVGKTLDDAAGEAFDKFAKLTGLGYPGGSKVDAAAVGGNPAAFAFPRPMLHDNNFNFSFAGLKTAAHNLLKTMSQDEIKKNIADLCASYQNAIVEVLVAKILRASDEFKIKHLSITGGVSANSQLRRQLAAQCEKKKLQMSMAPLRYCTDNAAMIGGVGLRRLLRGESSDFDLPPSAKSSATDFETLS